MPEVKTVHTWRGKTYHYKEENGEVLIETDWWRVATPEQLLEIKAEELAERYLTNEVLCCQSNLVDELIKQSWATSPNGSNDYLIEAFSYDEIENIYEDTDEFSARECEDYIEEHGLEWPLENEFKPPAKMNREELEEWWEIYLTNEGRPRAVIQPENVLREEIYKWMEDTCYQDDLREVCREHALDHPAEVFEWWLVTGWMCEQLRNEGQVVLDNSYGCWWGRTCTGQGIKGDGVFQRIAMTFLTDEAHGYLKSV